MASNRAPSALSLLGSLTVAFTQIGWGGYNLWSGLSYKGDMTSESEPVGAYSFHMFGAFQMCVGLLVLMIVIMKARAPAKRSERLTESADVTFDADAAIANYLERKRIEDTFEEPRIDPDLSAPPPAVTSPASATRPVFGRKSA